MTFNELVTAINAQLTAFATQVGNDVTAENIIGSTLFTKGRACHYVNTPLAPWTSSTIPLDITDAVKGGQSVIWYKGPVLSKISFTGGSVSILNGLNNDDELCLVFVEYDKDNSTFIVEIKIDGYTPGGGSGDGDMLKSVYDSNNDGKVNASDNADTVNGLTVETAVPSGAVFTDTIYNDSWIQPEIDTKVDAFIPALVKSANYSTANNNSETNTLLVFTAGTTVTLSSTGLTTGFKQQIFNDTGSDITIASANTILGANIPLVNGYYATYEYLGSNEWALAVGGVAGSGGGGAVDSVNGQTGAVVLDYTDVGAAATIHTHAIANVTGLQTALDGKEDDLGDPAINGYILSSTTGGVRSWIAPTSGGVTDHGALTGLSDDDHPQYLTEVRGAAIFATKESPAFTRDIWLQSDDLSEKLIFQKVGNNPTPGINWSIYALGGSGIFELATEGGSIILGPATSNRTITQINTLGDKAIVTKEWVIANTGVGGEFARRPLVTTLSSATETINPHVAYDQYLLKCSNATGMTITLNADGAFDGNEIKSITFIQDGAGQLTFADGTVTIKTAETKKTRKQYSMVTAIWTNTNEVYLTGDLELL